MSISSAFIARPIATSLLMAGILLVGAAAYPLIPVAPLPQVDFPTILVTTQLPARRIDRRLDILRGTVDVAREIELDRDCAVAERAARRHLGDARDLPELPLQRLGDRGCHDLGAGTG